MIACFGRCEDCNWNCGMAGTASGGTIWINVSSTAVAPEPEAEERKLARIPEFPTRAEPGLLRALPQRQAECLHDCRRQILKEKGRVVPVKIDRPGRLSPQRGAPGLLW